MADTINQLVYMIFQNILNHKTASLTPEFDRLFMEILANQSHSGDLLLVYVNAFYMPEVLTWTNVSKQHSPYAIGPDDEGHSAVLHHNYIGNYLKKTISGELFEDYLEKQEYSPARQQEIQLLIDLEGDSIQNEMLIYLKIWESDLFIKQLYQLVQLHNGTPYDWHFSIAESNRDKSATGTRENLLRKAVRDKLQPNFPLIYAAIKNAYRTQVRNSIAHSKYSFLGRYIHVNNYIENDNASQLQVVSFNEWIDMMHDSIVIYTQLVRLMNAVNDFYFNLASQNNHEIEVEINRRYPTVTTECQLLKARAGWRDWYWKSNESLMH